VTMHLLEDMGCDLIQGYILTRPLPLEEMIDWMSGQPKRSRISAS
jgi:EAL domain-containing protein (putative c-di-GMP-specific phosphodiesterase class I)